MEDKIEIKSYNESIFNAIALKKGSQYFREIKKDWKYKVYNPKIRTHCSHMTIQFNTSLNEETGEITKSLFIIGSLRKWYFGQLSFQDFTEITYRKALKLFAHTIGISLEELRSFTLSSIEIGINCRMDVDINYIKKGIYQFRDKRYQKKYDVTSIKFKSKKGIVTLKIYDKYQEIYDKCINKRIKSYEEEEFIKMHQHENNIRIELSLRGGQDLINKTLFRLRKGTKITIGTTIEHFDTLYTFFWTEVQKIKVSALGGLKEPQPRKSKDINTYTTAYYIEKEGIEAYKRITKKLSNRGYYKQSLHKALQFITQRQAYNQKRFLQNIRCRLYCLIGKDRKISRHKELIPYP